MSDTKPSNAVLCPECDALVGAGVDKCWLCGAVLVELDRAAAPRVDLPKLPRHETTRFSYSLGLLMTVVTLVCVSLGLVSIEPGLGIVFAFIVTPALIRTAIGAARRNVAGRPMDITQKMIAFGGSLGVVTVIAVTAGITFFATCFASGFAAAIGFEIANVFGGYDDLLWGAVVGVVIGIIPAGFVGYFLIRRLWPRKD